MLCILCTLCEKIFCKLSTRLLSPILTTRRWYRRRRDNATNTRARKKNFHALFSQNFSRSPSPKRLRTERANITPEQKAWAWGEGWRTREARQTKVEWPFAKLLDRKREIGCNPCAANRKCRTNIFVPFLFPFPLSARVFLLSPPLPLLPPSNFLGYPALPPLARSSRPAHRKSLPRRQLSAGGTPDWLRRKRVISVIRKASRIQRSSFESPIPTFTTFSNFVNRVLSRAP